MNDNAFQTQDEQLVEIAENFKILALVEWPKRTHDDFLASWKKGEPKIPKIVYPKIDFKEPLKQLDDIIKSTDVNDPVGNFIHVTAKSYHSAHLLVENMGQPEMTKYSSEVYGRPGDTVHGSTYTNIDAANFFIEVTDQFHDAYDLHEEDNCILATTIRDELDAATKKVITDDKIDILVDENLVPKAAAGVSRVRLRSGTCFSKYDMQQLLQHEVFVHTLTAINGRQQKNLKSLRLGSPRSTATQEGLATFAELVTGSIDLTRLKRIALRVIATDMALRGANFIDVFKFFIAHKQSEHESFSSSRRIFRGGDPRGSVAFTKDSVYLDGLLTAHSFFRWAMKNHRLDLAQVLFSGRLTFEDTEKLAPLMESGFISPPKYLPPWLSNIHTLGGYLAFSLFANKIKVDALDRKFAAQP
jgi:uncharacterized protein (TIGR02421 family)